MEILLLTIGKTTQKYIIDGIDEYIKRLRRYVQFRIISLPDIRASRAMTEDMQKAKEGESIIGFISSSDLCILLDEKGSSLSSKQFAASLQKMMSSGKKRAVFVVGGPYGFSQEVYERADAMISLSKMTFTHEMARLFFTEQVYRAMTILRGEPYHHE